MSLFKIFDIAGSAVQAQSMRLNTTASNLANAESAVGPDGQPYRARHVTFAAKMIDPADPSAGTGVRVTGVVEDTTAARKLLDPKNPLADSEGYVTMSNVNVIEEMVNMISASRSYQNNIEIMNTSKNLLLKTLQLGS
jgi:flagellar basal-body rod protein FlgC